MQQIPKYQEGTDPGFQELSVMDFAESSDDKHLIQELLTNIKAEYQRLRLTLEQIESVERSRIFGDLASESAFNLKMYLDWLKRLERKR